MHNEWFELRDAAMIESGGDDLDATSNLFCRMKSIEDRAVAGHGSALSRIRLVLGILEFEEVDSSAVAILRRLDADMSRLLVQECGSPPMVLSAA